MKKFFFKLFFLQLVFQIAIMESLINANTQSHTLISESIPIIVLGSGFSGPSFNYIQNIVVQTFLGTSGSTATDDTISNPYHLNAPNGLCYHPFQDYFIVTDMYHVLKIKYNDPITIKKISTSKHSN